MPSKKFEKNNDLNNKNSGVLFSIIVPTYNAERTIHELLLKLANPPQYTTEVILIDSESTDHTLKIVTKIRNKLKNFSLLKIKKGEFNHSETRNNAVRLAKGKFICFFSQDAVPDSENFLEYFAEDFRVYPKCVAVFGKQIPPKIMPLMLKIEMECKFEKLDKYTNNSGQLIFSNDQTNHKLKKENPYLWYALYNTFACYRKSYLLKNPFEKNAYFGDIIQGKKILESGFTKIYDSRARVKHYHILNLREYIKSQKKDYELRISDLKLKEFPNINSKIKKILYLNAGSITKIVAIFELFLYYFIKSLIILQLKYEKLLGNKPQ